MRLWEQSELELHCPHIKVDFAAGSCNLDYLSQPIIPVEIDRHDGFRGEPISTLVTVPYTGTSETILRM